MQRSLRVWAPALAVALVLAGHSSLTRAYGAAPDGALTINSKDYFDARGLNVLVFTNEYNGMFFDEKTAGIEMIHHGVRTVTGGAVRLKPTPEQWDQIPKVVSRNVDRKSNTIEVVLRYEEYDFSSRVAVTPDGAGFRVAVFLDAPVPERLEGRAGLNMEFLPSRYFERTYFADGKPGIFPRHPSGPTAVKPARTQVRQFEGYSTFDDRGRGEYVEPEPIAAGRTLVFAPEDPERRVRIQALDGELQLLDGRNVAQNGWFVVRSPLAVKKTGKVAEWLVQPHVIPSWTRPPVVGFSQAGYTPSQPKRAVIELDPNDTPLATLSVFEVPAEGTPVERLTVKTQPWGTYLRYSYVTADFSAIRQPGLYFLQYGAQRTETFPIDAGVYDTVWHLTADVWFPAQMDHMTVNEAYRVWHGLTHMDDALQAPVNIQHFDGYRMGPTTETKYKPLERIPGLAVGGWFDAGDFDIQTGSHASVILNMVATWESFRPMRDETLIDQREGFVDVHRPDGKPDLLQQIEHGTLQVAAQHRAFGRAIRGIVDSALHRYHHLGDAATQTDGLIYDPSMKPYQSDGRRSGTADDRWAFTGQTPSTNYLSIGALAAASRALRGFNDALADESLALARRSYAEERERAAKTPPTGPEAMFGQGAELTAVAQLLITTKEQVYRDRFDELLWPSLERAVGRGMGVAARALPFLDAAYTARLRPYVVKHKADLDGIFKQNPYGVPIATGGWGGNGGVIGYGSTSYYLHRAYPDLIGSEYVFRGLDFIFGTHPASNVSFVTAVGTRAKKVAYGTNRADMTIIPGGVVPGILVLKPDYPEHMDDWPFLWGENEVTIGICADYIFLANAASALAR